MMFVLLKVVGEWRFSLIHCDILLTLDVMMCTASILNLCAISIDRWIPPLTLFFSVLALNFSFLWTFNSRLTIFLSCLTIYRSKTPFQQEEKFKINDCSLIYPWLSKKKSTSTKNTHASSKNFKQVIHHPAVGQQSRRPADRHHQFVFQ